MAQSDEEQPIVVQSATTSSKGNTALEKENVLLRDQVIRLNKELYRYQKNAGTTSSTSSDRHQDDNEVMKSLSESEVTSPLFTAYDQRIEELSTFIERQGSVLDLLTERSNDLLSENEHLRHRIIQGLPKHKSDGIQESSTDIKKDAGINQLLSDKQLLEEQAELLVKEVQSANQTITSRDENIASLTEQVGNKLKEMQRLQKSMLQLAKHKADCEKELVTHIGHLAIQSDEIKDLKCCVDKLKKELSEQSSKAEGSDMDQQYLKGENETLTTKLTQSVSVIQELQNQVSSGTSEYIKSNEEYLAVKSDMTRTRAKIEQLEQSNIELKFTVNLTYEKEKELKQVERDLKMKVKELQLSTDKAEAKSSSLERELNRLLRQENEEDQSNGNTSSSNANRWEKNACQEIKRRDQLIHSLKIQNTELAIQAEKDRRKSDLNLTEQQNLQKCIQRERINTKNELEILQTELADAITKVKAEHQQKVEIMNEKCALQQEITSLQESFSINKGELERLQEEDKRKSQEFIELRIRLQTKIDESNEALQKETSKMIDEKESMLLERDEMMNKNDNRLDSVQTKIDQLELSLKESMVLNQNLRKQIQSQTNNYTNQQKDLESMFQSKMVECQESFDDQVKKNYEVMSTLRRVSEQKLDLDVILKKCNQQIYQSERKLIAVEEKVSLLSKQLHDNLCDQSDKISQIKALKMELRQLKAMKVQE